MTWWWHDMCGQMSLVSMACMERHGENLVIGYSDELCHTSCLVSYSMACIAPRQAYNNRYM